MVGLLLIAVPWFPCVASNHSLQSQNLVSYLLDDRECGDGYSRDEAITEALEGVLMKHRHDVYLRQSLIYLRGAFGRKPR